MEIFFWLICITASCRRAAVAASVPGTTQANITLAFVSFYCDLPKTPPYRGTLLDGYDVKPTEVDLNGLSGHLYWNDIAMVAAVEMANNMSILGASSSIAIKRFTDCKLSSPDEQYTGNSGGFASSIVAQDIAENHHDVIGAVGYEFSTTASGLAEALSFHKIPYCSSVSGSPRFRNKANYSYMFRTISTDYGEHLYQLYRAWNIRQVAIIYQSDDDLGFQTFISIDSALRDRGIVVVSKVGLRTDFSPADAQYAALLIMRTTARYFIISGTQEFVSEIIYRMGKLDLVKAGRVWMSYNTPLPRIDEYDQEYDKFLEGFILLFPQAPNVKSTLFERVYHRVTALANVSISQFDFVYTFGLPYSFDCVMMMILGFQSLLRYENNTLSMLAGRKLQHLMNHTLFAALGYDGVSATPMELDTKGDLKLGCEFLIYGNNGTHPTAFGATNVNATAFSYYPGIEILFNGGLSKPPADGAPAPLKLYHPLRSHSGIAFSVLTILGLLTCMASTAFIVRYKHKEAVKASSIPECILIVAGCFIGYICAILTLFDATDLLCEIRMWTLVLGFSTALSTLVSKNILLGVMFEYRIRKPQKLMFKIRCGNACVIALIVGMLVYWTETNDGMTHLDLFQDSSSYYNLCINNSWNVFYVGVCLYLALVLSLFFIRNVRWSTYNESTTISIITLSIPLLYFMMDTVSSKNNASINSANRRAACIWALVTIILIMVVGTRIFDFITEEGMLSSLINRFFKRISKMKTSVANLAEARTDYVRAASSTTSVQRTGFSLSKKTGTYKRRLLLMTTDFHVYRARVNEQRKWSNWKKEVAELNYMNGRVWLSLLSSSSTACFIIVDIGVQMRIDGSLVIIESSSNKGDKDQFPMKYTLQLEYESPETAQAFASELKQALEWK